MGGGTTGGTELLSDETAEEVAKLSEAARNELEEKKKLAEQLAAKEKSMAEEIERLRAELKEAAPPSPEKQTLSEADAEAVRKIEQQARKEDEEAYCTFEVLDKHQLLDFPEGALLPKYQDIKRDHPTMLVPFRSPSPRRARACTSRRFSPSRTGG